LAWWIAVFASGFVRQSTLGDLDPLPVAVFDIPLFVIASAVAAFGVRVAATVSTVWTILLTLGLASYATITGEAGWGVLLMAAAAAGSVLALSLMLLGGIPTAWIIRGPFSFRAAVIRRTAAPQVAATFAQIIVFWTFFLAVVPQAIVYFERRWSVGLPPVHFAGIVGTALLILASALGIWSALAISLKGDGTPLPSAMPNRLVIAGPYRWVRNPMAIAGFAQGVAVGFVLQSWLVVGYAVVGSVLWNFAVRPLEEHDLEERFGDEFRSYRAAVRCWVPRVPGARG
jgi:protein-S-isoprenylcysteine O-methyltransferase Ste14